MQRVTRQAKATTPTHAVREMNRAHASLSNELPAGSYWGNQAALRRLSRTTPHLQCRLEIGAANDPLEAEADRVADQVMRMPDPALSNTGASGIVRRKCAACEEEDAAAVQTKSAGGVNSAPAGGKSGGTMPSRDFGKSVSGAGHPMSARVRDSMEPRFGHDFSAVRIHTAVTEADDPARIGALAYTIGNDVVFSQNQYDPHSATGQQLLAHELAHVVQQGAAPDLSAGPSPQLTAAGKQGPQFGLFSAAKCAYYTWKMGDIFTACRAEYNKNCGGDMLSEGCLKYMDSLGAGFPSDAIYNCARRKDPGTFKSWLESCAKTATGSYGNSKWTSNDTPPADNSATASNAGPADNATPGAAGPAQDAGAGGSQDSPSTAVS